MNYNVSDLIEELEGLGKILNDATNKHGNAEIDYTMLHNAKKTIFAEVVKNCIGKNTAEKEREAYLDPSWISWNDKYTRAECEMIKTRMFRDIAKTDYQNCIMKMSALKSEIKVFGG